MSTKDYPAMSTKDYLAQQFIDDIGFELRNAWTKFPHNDDLLPALMEKVGELAQAMQQMKHEPELGVTHEAVRNEALQVAALATRIAAEGDVGYPYHPESAYRGPNWSGYKQRPLFKCDGDHPTTRLCLDPECWLKDPIVE